ncbi:MAG: MFS transporter [Candidatus Omnitrophica bacterium]|nr:MFS transporter [Candidatus Omnitrophota bacterium]
MNFRKTFSSLKHRNFRLFVCGQSISLIGTWMQMVAVSWLVYRLTNSAFLLGVVGFSSQVPSFLLAPFAGVFADRYNRHRILLMVQVFSLVQAVIMAWLVVTNSINIVQIITLSFFLGLVNAFDLPVRQSFISEMIDDRKDLSNAIALHSSLYNGSRLFGPALAGVVIAVMGEGWCFVLNALSFLPIIIALWMMRFPLKNKEQLPHKKVNSALKEGIRYAFHFMPIRTLLVTLAVVSFLTGMVQTLMPVFVKDIYHGGPKALGFVLSMSGVGALCGALYLAGRQTVVGLGRLIGFSSIILGFVFVSLGLITNLWLAGISALLMGLVMILAISSVNVILQTLVEENMRGRVMSLYGAALIGMAPLGSLAAGWLAGKIGLSLTMVLGSGVAFLASFIYWQNYPLFRSQIRTVYAQKGIIPEA